MMHFINLVALLIVLLTNGALGFLPRLISGGNIGFQNNNNNNNDNAGLPLLASGNDDNFPLQDNIPYEENDRSVYDPGVANMPSYYSGSGNLAIDVPDSLVGPPQPQDENAIDSDADALDKLRNEIREEKDIAVKSAALLQLLEKTAAGGPLPIVYVEEDDPTPPFERNQLDKRSGRYYRRYPWKRQNTRSRPYESDTRYLCVPSRDDVFKLLVGLHENRNGNHHKTVNFCNRKRPAKSIFTNIRFLG